MRKEKEELESLLNGSLKRKKLDTPFSNVNLGESNVL